MSGKTILVELKNGKTLRFTEMTNWGLTKDNFIYVERGSTKAFFGFSLSDVLYFGPEDFWTDGGNNNLRVDPHYFT